MGMHIDSNAKSRERTRDRHDKIHRYINKLGHDIEAYIEREDKSALADVLWFTKGDIRYYSESDKGALFSYKGKTENEWPLNKILDIRNKIKNLDFMQDYLDD